MIIDFHAHILPGLDHGSLDVETSLNQLKMAKNSGVDLIVATSHFYPHKDSVDAFIQRRETAISLLQSAPSGDYPNIIAGAETLVCDGMEHMQGLMGLAFGSCYTMLLEMPSGPWSLSLYDTIEKINQMTNGHAVMAHVDRYDPHRVESLFEIGVRGQLNAENLCKLRLRKKLLKWVTEGKIVALGSDIHGGGNAYRKFSKAISILGKDLSPVMKSSRDLLGDFRVINQILRSGSDGTI